MNIFKSSSLSLFPTSISLFAALPWNLNQEGKVVALVCFEWNWNLLYRWFSPSPPPKPREGWSDFRIHRILALKAPGLHKKCWANFLPTNISGINYVPFTFIFECLFRGLDGPFLLCLLCHSETIFSIWSPTSSPRLTIGHLVTIHSYDRPS